MITSLTGLITRCSEGTLTLDVHGVGFEITVPQSAVFMVNSQTSVLIYFNWSAENGPTLYGFTQELERSLFALVISCSGMGPKLAMALLSSLSPAVFIQAIQSGDEKTLSKVSGVGVKKAEQLIVQLKHKVPKLLDQVGATDLALDPALEQWKNITQVLQTLHYSRPEIDAALAHMQKEHAGQPSSFDLLMRTALSFLAKKR